MAVDLATAKKYYQTNGQGAQPPAGMAFDDWVLQWFNGAVNAGTPSAVKASGGTAAEGADASQNYSTGGQAGWQNAAPSSEWLGKRNPTPRELRRYAHDTGQSEDYARYDDKQLAAWIGKSWNPGGYFTNDYGDRVEKPTEAGANTPQGMTGAGAGSAGGGGAGGFGGGAGGASGFAPGALPTFNWSQFTPPTAEEALNAPGAQFRIGQGLNALQHSQAAQGLTRTGGSLKDLIDYGQQAASQEYGNLFNQKLQGWGANYQGAKDQFAPLYGAWQTEYGGNLSKWNTLQSAALQKYLQKEQNIYGLLNPSMPAY